MDKNLNFISEHGSAVVNDDICASSMHENIIRKTIGKTTYIANLHFKEQGKTFSQKLKRVLRADCSS